MKVSLKWLNNYINVADFNKNPHELARILTSAGLEVEAIEEPGKSFQYVVVGEVVELEKHPQADKLTLCQVAVGEAENFQIVCGAKNFKVNNKVVVALPQAVLPGNFKIKISKIRGIESRGMLCSESELGLASQSNGILVLPKEASVGESYAVYAGLDDVIFDIYIPTNRGDCMGHVGIARELSCLLDRPMKLSPPVLKTQEAFTKSSVKVLLKNKKDCLRYSGRAMRGVTVKKSPPWLVNHLNAVGVNSINNIVDATNFVMLEYGQPLHAFDSKALKGQSLVIELAQEGEKFKTLDGTELSLKSNHLTIRDGERPVALAGVVGGENSGVLENTSDLFIESANFTSETVRKTSRDFNIQTESSLRFSKGCDVELVPQALDRVCALIQELAGGEVASDKYDEREDTLKPKVVLLRYSTLEERLGYAVSQEHVQQVMKKLGSQILESSSTQLKLQLPSFRFDLQAEIDLVEEYARLNGYDKIPETLPTFSLAPSAHDPSYVAARALENQFVRQGFSQAMNHHFLSEGESKIWTENTKNFQNVGLEEVREPIKIKNPLSEEFAVMRSSLFLSLFKNLLYNYRHGQAYGRLFEIGPVFSRDKKDSKNFFEPQRAGAILWGEPQGLWQKEALAPAIFYMKASLQNICSSLNLKVEFLQKESLPSFLHPSQSVALFFQGKPIGYVGSLHPSLKVEFKIKEDVAVFEWDCERLMSGYPKKPQLKPLSKYPKVYRDMALVLPESLAVGEVIKYIQKKGASSLREVEAFDDYKGKPLKSHEHSVTFRMTYQDFKKTLTEQELTFLQEAITAEVCKKFSVSLR